MEKNKPAHLGEYQDRRLPFCTYAPEWAEHARFGKEEEPCDDGRSGNVCGRREGEDSCDIGARRMNMG